MKVVLGSRKACALCGARGGGWARSGRKLKVFSLSATWTMAKSQL
jgi:hypothetical protein